MVSENKLPDIDIDMKNREDILSIISTIPASKVDGTKITPHNTGVYFQNIPTEPFRGLSSIDYQRAEELGYIKVDFLNLSFLNNFSSNTEIDQLLEKEPEFIEGLYAETCFRYDSPHIYGETCKKVFGDYLLDSIPVNTLNLLLGGKLD